MQKTSSSSAVPDNESVDARLAALEDENALLLDQLHVVQEELERSFLGRQADGSVSSSNGGTVILRLADDEFVESIAGHIRLQALLDVRQEIHALESENTLQSRLGNLLIQSVHSASSLAMLPYRLQHIWRQWSRKEPPSKLGGKGYELVIAAYHDGGFQAVEILLAGSVDSPNLQANAFTALARSLMETDLAACVDAARRAYALDPRMFRLKWLAFRLHEVGEVVRAEAMLDSLPADMQFSGSEARQATRLRTEARQARVDEARKRMGYAERRAEVEQQFSQLTRARDTHAKLAAARLEEIETLQGELVRRAGEVSVAQARHGELEGALVELAQERDEARRHAATGLEEIGVLQARLARREEEAVAAQARHGELEGALAELAQARDKAMQHAAKRVGQLLEVKRLHLAAKVENRGLGTRVKDLERHVETMMASHCAADTLMQRIDMLYDCFEKHEKELYENFTQQSNNFIGLREHVTDVITRNVANARRQIHAACGMQQYIGSGLMPVASAEGNSWPISPDFSLCLVRCIEFNDYDMVVEFGSGLSTVVVAKALAHVATRKQRRGSVPFISFDHLEQYYRQTHVHLELAGVGDSVQLHLAPLYDYIAPSGKVYPYYSCLEQLADAAAQFSVPDLRLLVIVDGPPAATGKHARYPALPLCMNYFPDAQIDLLLDDYIRDDEKEVVALWRAELEAVNRAFKVAVYKLEKGACLVSIAAKTGQVKSCVADVFDKKFKM
jgi:chaperonin cofactor prefoldin